jgi:hypothetical protein
MLVAEARRTLHHCCDACRQQNMMMGKGLLIGPWELPEKRGGAPR